MEGGTPVEVANVLGKTDIGRMSISRDGKMIAYPFEEYTPMPKAKIAVIPVEGGPPLQIFDAPGGVGGSLLWSPDGKSLEYILTQNGSPNIWEQPLHGGRPHQLTAFSDGKSLTSTGHVTESDCCWLAEKSAAMWFSSAIFTESARANETTTDQARAPLAYTQSPYFELVEWLESVVQGD